MPVPQSIQDALDKAVSAKNDADASLRDKQSKDENLKVAQDAKANADAVLADKTVQLASALKDLEKAEDDFFVPSVG